MVKNNQLELKEKTKQVDTIEWKHQGERSGGIGNNAVNSSPCA